MTGQWSLAMTGWASTWPLSPGSCTTLTRADRCLSEFDLVNPFDNFAHNNISSLCLSVAPSSAAHIAVSSFVPSFPPLRGHRYGVGVGR
jgi:hypothetical protein